MRGGALPPALLMAALGFALAFAPRSTRLPALALAVLGAIAASFAPWPRSWQDPLFLSSWSLIVLAVASVHLPKGVGPRLALSLAGLVGVFAGAVVAVAGRPSDLLKALPPVLIVYPASWLIARKLSIAVKVMSSWLVAIALLAATLPLTTKTPGYAPDHMD